MVCLEALSLVFVCTCMYIPNLRTARIFIISIVEGKGRGAREICTYIP